MVDIVSKRSCTKMLPFDGKSAVVTGGASGIGHATVKHFLEQGIKNIAILDLNDLKNVTQSLQNIYTNQTVIFIKTDVTQKNQVKSAFAEVASKFQFIDYVVGSAGIVCEKDYELTINVNVLGVLHTTYTAIEFMSKEKGGRGGIIANIASVAGLDAYYTSPTYGASKYAIVGFNHCFSNEYYFNKYGIKFITICPSYTDTPLLDDLANKLGDVDIENTVKMYNETPKQTADIVGRCIVDTFVLGKNGSVWIIEDGSMREITLHKYLPTK